MHTSTITGRGAVVDERVRLARRTSLEGGGEGLLAQVSGMAAADCSHSMHGHTCGMAQLLMLQDVLHSRNHHCLGHLRPTPRAETTL